MVAATPATPANPSNPATMAMMKNMSAHLSIPQSLRRPHLINSGCFRFSAWGEPRSPIPSSELRVWNWGTTITRPRVSEFQSFRVSGFWFQVSGFEVQASEGLSGRRSTVAGRLPHRPVYLIGPCPHCSRRFRQNPWKTLFRRSSNTRKSRSLKRIKAAPNLQNIAPGLKVRHG